MCKPRSQLTGGLLLALLLNGATAHAESGVLAHDSALLDQPFADALTTANLPAQSPVTVISRQGRWIQVQTTDGSSSGWVSIFDVNTAARGSAGTAPASDHEADLLARGQAAAPESEWLSRLASSSAQAAAAARKAGLAPVPLAWLPGSQP